MIPCFTPHFIRICLHYVHITLVYFNRYVREWINGMVCGGVVDHEEIEGVDRYWLEPYRLPALLGDSFRWPALDAEMLSACLEVYTKIEECFRLTGPSGT